MIKQTQTHRFGYLAVVGRPNVGKSTLFNYMIGKNVSAVTRKAQTTQDRIMGVVHRDHAQFVMFDTPGVKTRLSHRHLGHLNRLAKQATYEADVALFMVSGSQWTQDDDQALEILHDFTGPVIGVLNKIDRVVDDEKIQKSVDRLASKRAFEKIVTVSAKRGQHVALLEQEILPLIPIAPTLYSAHEITTHTEAFMASEILRAKILENLHEEIPYICSITLDAFEKKDNHTYVSAVIWVPQASHKPMLIGKEGSMLKRIGMQARQDMQQLMGQKVVLKSWVKVGQPQEHDKAKATDFGTHG